MLGASLIRRQVGEQRAQPPEPVEEPRLDRTCRRPGDARDLLQGESAEEPQRARLPLGRGQFGEGRRHAASHLVVRRRRFPQILRLAERQPAPQALRPEPVAGQVAGDGEDPRPQRRTLAPAVAMAMEAARIAVETVRSTPTEVELVRLVAFDEATHRLYAKLLKG